MTASDGEYRMSDAELARLADTPGRWSRPLALEVFALRGQVKDLEQARNWAAWFAAERDYNRFRMECANDCGNCNVCRLSTTTHIRSGQLQASRKIADEARAWARWFAAERDQSRADRAEELGYIAARHDRERTRIARALQVIEKRAGWDLANIVRAVLEGNDE